MQAPAIHDHVSSKLYAWYTLVSEWEPPGRGFTGICSECRSSALASTIDITVWPHDVIHLLVQSLRSAIADVEDSYREEFPWNAGSAAEVARAAVELTLEGHADDIVNVIDRCTSQTG